MIIMNEQIKQLEKQLEEIKQFNAACSLHQRKPISGLQFKIDRLKKKMEGKE